MKLHRRCRHVCKHNRIIINIQNMNFKGFRKVFLLIERVFCFTFTVLFQLNEKGVELSLSIVVFVAVRFLYGNEMGKVYHISTVKL